jgi:hypothetical protein
MPINREALIRDIVRIIAGDSCCKCKQHDCKHRAQKIEFVIGPVSNRIIETKKGNTNMSLILTDEQKVALSVAFLDKAGNAAKVDGAPVWGTSDPNVVVLDVAADGLSAVAVTAGPLGKSQVSVSADADLGEGIVTIVGTLDIEVVGGAAATVGIAAGTPESK